MHHQTDFTFLDADGASVLIWRPTKAPPLLKTISGTVEPIPKSKPCAQVGMRAVSETRAPMHAPVPVSASSSVRATPPAGQLLPRGIDGIDGVLRRAREAQQLHWYLQEQRLRREKRDAQHRLRKDLDDQREYKRMLRLAEYQEELVNVFGPTVQNIICDTFFDDGTDPALQVLAAQRAQSTTSPPLPSRRSPEESRRDVLRAWRMAREEHQEMGGLDVTAVDREMEVLCLPERQNALAQPDTALLSRQKEVLKKALDHHRQGKRMPF